MITTEIAFKIVLHFYKEEICVEDLVGSKIMVLDSVKGSCLSVWHSSSLCSSSSQVVSQSKCNEGKEMLQACVGFYNWRHTK